MCLNANFHLPPSPLSLCKHKAPIHLQLRIQLCIPLQLTLLSIIYIYRTLIDSTTSPPSLHSHYITVKSRKTTFSCHNEKPKVQNLMLLIYNLINTHYQPQLLQLSPLGNNQLTLLKLLTLTALHIHLGTNCNLNLIPSTSGIEKILIHLAILVPIYLSSLFLLLSSYCLASPLYSIIT